MAGRTLWRAKDCEWSMRDRVVALGEEFGPAGPMVLDWLEEQAKKQRGRVLTGFRAVARGAFLQGGAEEAERIVAYATRIGSLDDFDRVDELRFQCRVSGFGEDQEMAQAAARQRSKRARGTSERDTPEPGVTERDSDPNHRDLEPNPDTVTNRDKTVLAVTPTRVRGQERKEERQHPSSTATAGDVETEVREDVHRLCHLLADQMLANDPKAKVAPDSKRWRDAARLLIDVDGRTENEVENVIRFTQADDFERTVVLSMTKLRERFTGLALKASRGRPPARDEDEDARERRFAERAGTFIAPTERAA